MKTKTYITMLNLQLFVMGGFVLAPTAHAYYDPSLARWINRDPIDEKGFGAQRRVDRNSVADGPNSHCFVKNQPVSDVDPHGLLGGWGYGKYCGWSRSGPGVPDDPVDAACMKHDACLATWWDAFTPGKFLCCNVAFCGRVAVADCSGSPTPRACEDAKFDILRLCALVLINPMTGL